MERGLLAELSAPEDVVSLIVTLRRLGYVSIDAFVPYPQLEIEEALGLERSNLSWVVFPVSLAAAGLGYFIQWACNAWDYPINVGGRPAHAVPAFIPITFETMVLLTGLFTFTVLLLRSGLPRLHHPVFEIDGFERATRDRFWLAVDAEDPLFQLERTRRELAEAGAMRIEWFGEPLRHGPPGTEDQPRPTP
jgi:hypothetical protein